MCLNLPLLHPNPPHLQINAMTGRATLEGIQVVAFIGIVSLGGEFATHVCTQAAAAARQGRWAPHRTFPELERGDDESLKPLIAFCVEMWGHIKAGGNGFVITWALQPLRAHRPQPPYVAVAQATAPIRGSSIGHSPHTWQ